MSRVITIQKDRDGFVWIVNVVVDANNSRTFWTRILERPKNKLVWLFESDNESNVEQWNWTQDEISRGKEGVDEENYEKTL